MNGATRRVRPYSRYVPPKVPALAATVVLAASLVFAATSSAASLALAKCAGGWECGKLTVPAERGSGSTRTLELGVWRLKFTGEAAAEHSASAVFALAGGPGQAAVPLREGMRELIAPALTDRDMIVIDQRGTGESSPLDCAGLAAYAATEIEEIEDIERCAHEVNTIGSFTTAESVQDMEAVRAALGYEKLVVYGTSYGTKVALNYAERFPKKVESLVLDSVVPPAGVEPFDLESFKAVAGMLAELCSQGPCRRFARNPVGELATLASRLSRAAILGSYTNGRGNQALTGMDAAGLWGLLEEGDLNPGLRALLPAAVHAALAGHYGQLLRLQGLADGAIPTLPRSSGGEAEVDETLFLATDCEETPFPWSRSSGYASRLQGVEGALRAIPAASFYPFSAKVSASSGLFSICAAWPDASPAPPATTTPPDVPTLILSGGQDLRTPTANARAVAAEIPDAQLLVVPFTGHSVLGTDFSKCSHDAVVAFFASQPVQPCGRTSEPFPPTPPAPERARSLATTAGIRGLPGRTVTAALATLDELRREAIAAVFASDSLLPTGTSFGGLHGGYAVVHRGWLGLHDYSVVPGVALSGVVSTSGLVFEKSVLRIGGRRAAHGSLTVTARGTSVRGRLGGRRFDRRTAAAKIAAAGRERWPSPSARFLDAARGERSPSPLLRGPRAARNGRWPSSSARFQTSH